MIDRLPLMYLIHALEIPDELRDGAVVTAQRRAPAARTERGLWNH